MRAARSGLVALARAALAQGGDLGERPAGEADPARLRRGRDPLIVEPAGPACHRRAQAHTTAIGRPPRTRSCPLSSAYAERRATPPQSYTATLLADPPLIGEKVWEEAEEVARAAREEPDERVAEEAADVLYHLTVLLASRGLRLADGYGVLDERRR